MKAKSLRTRQHKDALLRVHQATMTCFTKDQALEDNSLQRNLLENLLLLKTVFRPPGEDAADGFQFLDVDEFMDI